MALTLAEINGGRICECCCDWFRTSVTAGNYSRRETVILRDELVGDRESEEESRYTVCLDARQTGGPRGDTLLVLPGQC